MPVLAGVNIMIDLAVINQITGGKLGEHDVACPLCGPHARAPANQRREVLRIWYLKPGFATFCCKRCDASGYTRDSNTSCPDPIVLARVRSEAAERQRVSVAERLVKARRLSSQSKPITGTIAEKYLQTRGIACTLPSTLRYLPASGKHSPAMIAAFGIPNEPEPSLLVIDDSAVRGIHLTRLSPDGGKAGTERDKIMIGRSAGSPIVLAPPNDSLGLAICEGIEDGLSIYAATGLGVWCAGSASRMPALAAAIPDYIECVTVFAHDDDAGQRGALDLAEALSQRGIAVLVEGLQ
jgi:hypothetical protein